jgi:hypothetical protein
VRTGKFVNSSAPESDLETPRYSARSANPGGNAFLGDIAHLAPFLRILKRDNLWHAARDWWHASAPYPDPANQTGRADFAHRLSDKDSLGFAHGRLVLEQARRTRPSFA